jgi:hypothetical protein
MDALGKISPIQRIEEYIYMSFYDLNSTDEFPVLKKCRKCGGKKEVQDESGNTSPCTTCDDRGKEIVLVPFRDLVAYIRAEIVKQSRQLTRTHK